MMSKQPIWKATLNFRSPTEQIINIYIYIYIVYAYLSSTEGIRARMRFIRLKRQSAAVQGKTKLELYIPQFSKRLLREIPDLLYQL